MELIACAHVDSPFNFSFENTGKTPEQLLQLDNVVLGYGQHAIVSDVEMLISPGQRIGLLGANGAGKSTLVKCLAGELIPMSGEVRRADVLKIGYFAQHQLEQLQVDESPLWHLQQLDSKAREKELRQFLGGFAFTGDKALDPVGPFSGGEKARLVLAMLVYQNPNLLLLDEPTNHLDLEMRHALSMALQDFEGALIVVSHDRHLLKSVTDQLLLVASGTVNTFDGDLDDYHKWLLEQKKTDDQIDQSVDKSLSRKQLRQIEAEKRQQLKPMKRVLVKAEKRVEQLHQQQDALEQQLADPAIYENQDKDILLKLLREKTDIDRALENAEAEWLDASDQLEQMT
jgi:ATP-binding cassette subfamily F protein 3